MLSLTYDSDMRGGEDPSLYHAGYDQSSISSRDSADIWHTISNPRPTRTFDRLESTEEIRPHNWIVPAILCAIVCFPPTGIAAIYFARKANRMVEAGDIGAARHFAGIARAFIITSMLCLIVWVIILLSLQSMDVI